MSELYATQLYTEKWLKWHMLHYIFYHHKKKGIHELQGHEDLRKEGVSKISRNQYRAFPLTEEPTTEHILQHPMSATLHLAYLRAAGA